MYTSGVTYLVQLLVSAFLAILFLQSGVDKIADRQGNLEWLKGHFSKSPLAGTVPILFAALTIIEVALLGRCYEISVPIFTGFFGNRVCLRSMDPHFGVRSDVRCSGEIGPAAVFW